MCWILCSCRLEIDLLQGELVAQATNEDDDFTLNDFKFELKNKDSEIARLKHELVKVQQASKLINQLQLENEKLQQIINTVS